MLLNKLQDENKELFLRLEMLLVNIDGKYCDSERRLVEQHCREMGIQPIEYDKTVTIEKIAETINREMSVEERKIILIELITVAIIDGVYDEREKEFVEYLRKMLHMPKEVGEQALALVQKLIDAAYRLKILLHGRIVCFCFTFT